MKKIMRMMVIALMGSAILAGTASAKEWLISLDLSSSTLLTNDREYAQRAGTYARQKLAEKGFSMGDRLRVRSLGEFGAGANVKIDARASRKYRPDKLLGDIEYLIGSVPALIEKNAGKFKVHNQTNILGHLRSEAYTLDCSTGGGVILLSDALESSEYVRASDLANGRTGLPEPKDPFLSGCDLIIIGIGQLSNSASGKVTDRLVVAWKDWSQKAGVRRFSPVPNF